MHSKSGFCLSSYCNGFISGLIWSTWDSKPNWDVGVFDKIRKIRCVIFAILQKIPNTWFNQITLHRRRDCNAFYCIFWKFQLYVGYQNPIACSEFIDAHFWKLIKKFIRDRDYDTKFTFLIERNTHSTIAICLRRCITAAVFSWSLANISITAKQLSVVFVSYRVLLWRVPLNVNASEATTFATGKFTVTVQAGKEERAKTLNSRHMLGLLLDFGRICVADFIFKWYETIPIRRDTGR